MDQDTVARYTNLSLPSSLEANIGRDGRTNGFLYNRKSPYPLEMDVLLTEGRLGSCFWSLVELAMLLMFDILIDVALNLPAITMFGEKLPRL